MHCIPTHGPLLSWVSRWFQSPACCGRSGRQGALSLFGDLRCHNFDCDIIGFTDSVEGFEAEGPKHTYRTEVLGKDYAGGYTC